jgi:hypothetical protein
VDVLVANPQTKAAVQASRRFDLIAFFLVTA